ncbi:hypothetical protein WJ02_21340 [Burkholderia vietnamiensis]|nr:hypothetical protein WJ02_21340 [Burkholderia vietnamiensis]
MFFAGYDDDFLVACSLCYCPNDFEIFRAKVRIRYMNCIALLLDDPSLDASKQLFARAWSDYVALVKEGSPQASAATGQ